MLGAGALAAAGLRSITAKHLAMAAQCVGAVMGLHPALAAILTGPLPHSRRAIMLPDFERLSQVITGSFLSFRGETAGCSAVFVSSGHPGCALHSSIPRAFRDERRMATTATAVWKICAPCRT